MMDSHPVCNLRFEKKKVVEVKSEEKETKPPPLPFPISVKQQRAIWNISNVESGRHTISGQRQSL